ncbi:LuxR C-terminal-related transcriptional regulator [Pseudobacter ginsenosidimutans]|nr:LuxR C-terminal-related transcriptional regulator [Pseudobacter ginsenosidimutans]
MINCVPATPQTPVSSATSARLIQHPGDYDSLYSACKQAAPDNVHRICSDFFRSHGIRKFPEEMVQFCKQLKDRCQKENNQSLLRRMVLVEKSAQLKYQHASPEDADKEFEALYNDYIKELDHSAALETLFELAQYQHRTSRNIQAIKVLFFAEKIAIKYGLQQDISFQAILHKIGYILWELDKPQRSIDYFKRSLATGKGITMDSLVSLNGIGINYQKMDSLAESVRYFDEASATALASGNTDFNTVVQGSSAVTLYKMGRYAEAYHNLMKEKELSFRENLWGNASEDFYWLVKIELQRNRLAACKALLDSFNAITPAIRSDDYASFKKKHEAAYLYYEKLQDHKNALASYKAFVRYDSLFQDHGNKNKISELELDAAVRVYEDEMASKERAKKTRAAVELVIVTVITTFIGLIIYLLYRKIKRIEIDKTNTEKINLQREAEIQALKVQLLSQLETIRNENSNFQAPLALKTNAGSGNSLYDEIPVLPGEELDREPESLLFLKEFNLAQKEQWNEFKNSFNKVYPAFEKSIVQRIGPVSGAELRLMMLHKLGLNNKEIAHTLLISPDSVKKAKYRLYKKIGINSAEELDEFLA